MPDQIRAALHLSDDASDADVVTAIAKLAEEPADDTVTLAEHEKATKALDAAIKRLEAVEKSHGDLLRDTYLTEQFRAGKVDPAEMDDLKELFDAVPDKVKAMIERRQPNVLLSTLGHGDNEKTTTGDVREVGSTRDWLDTAAKRLMAEDSKLDYGQALILAEKAGQSA